jgi:phosphoribosyl-AMP cyclohydrolase
VELPELTYDEKGLIPAVIQQYDTGEVLMVAWMDETAVMRTLETGKTWFWSRSRQQYWMKGETSGNTQDVQQVLYDCDADTLLVKVDQTGVACHTGERSCFYRELDAADGRDEGTGDEA